MSELFTNASADTDAPTEVVLGADITADAGDTKFTRPNGRHLVLDLNGHTIDRNMSAAASDGYVDIANSNSSLTIRDDSFTGTPISDKDRDTQEVFGDYIDVYDMTQAVEDGATMPVYYESSVITLKLNDDVLQEIDEEYERLRDEGADEADIEENKKVMAHMDELLGNDQTVDALVGDILEHYEDNRQYICGGKAMIVAYSRPIAMKIYRRILALRPTWDEKVKVVMTGGNKDPEEWTKMIGGKAYKKNSPRNSRTSTTR